MDLFNVCYEILLLMLQRFFAHTEETDAQLRALADGTYALMAQAIKPLGDLITRLPAGPEYPGQAAGPSFELFYESDYVLPHREAAAPGGGLGPHGRADRRCGGVLRAGRRRDCP
jgi:hypothetical protein